MTFTFYDTATPIDDGRNVRAGEVVHIPSHVATLGTYMKCGKLLHLEESDWDGFAKNADWVDEPANCLACIGSRGKITEEEEDAECLRSLTKSTS